MSDGGLKQRQPEIDVFDNDAYPCQHRPIFNRTATSMNQQKLDSLLERTGIFQAAVISHISGLTPAPGTRHVIALQAAALSIEHAAGALLLFKHNLLTPAYSLMRPQYESLVRGVWLLYAASELWVEKLSELLTEESARRANEGLMPAEMLNQLEGCARAPAYIVGQLQEYKSATWKALNSYAHGGIHALARSASGYPPKLTFDVVCNSNAIVALATQLASILTGDAQNMLPVKKIHVEFADCLPILNPT